LEYAGVLPRNRGKKMQVDVCTLFQQTGDRKVDNTENARKEKQEQENKKEVT